MLANSRDLIILLSVLGTAVFLWRFIADKNMSAISFSKLLPFLKVLIAIVVPVVAVLLCSSLLGFAVAGAAPYFGGAVVLAYVFSQIGLKPFLRGLLLLGGSVALTAFLPQDGYQLPIVATLAGLVSWKAIENLVSEDSSAMEDFLPPFLYLTGMYWTKTVETASVLSQFQNLILASFVATLLIRWIQDPSLKKDKLYVKRICLAVIGGLVLLLMITKMIVALDLAKYAAIAGAGFFLTYLFEAMDKACESDSTAQKCFKQVLFIGIFTLLATRLLLTPGLIVLAVSTLIATKSGVARIAALYWGGYVLLQAFIFQFNSNMTGINVMHTYVSAALYAGLLMAITAYLMLKQTMDNRSRALLFVSAGLIAPAATNYFLHAEATGSLLLATLIGSTLMSVFSPAFGGEQAKPRENLMLVPIQLISVGILTNELITKGNESDTQERMIALVVLSVVSTILLTIALHWPRRSDSSKSDPSNSDTPSEEQPAEA